MSLNIKVVKGVSAKSVMGKTIVCDTDPFFTEGLKAGIAKVAEGTTPSVVCFEKGGEVMELLREYPEEEYIVFLSMELPDCNSIILANQISNLQPAAQIIFVSANDSAYLDVYEAEHIYFLKKPLDEQYLRKAMRKAFFQLER